MGQGHPGHGKDLDFLKGKHAERMKQRRCEMETWVKTTAKNARMLWWEGFFLFGVVC